MAVCILITGRLKHTDIKWFPNKPYGSAQPASVQFYLNALPKKPTNFCTPNNSPVIKSSSWKKRALKNMHECSLCKKWHFRQTNFSVICVDFCVFLALFSVLIVSLAENTACLQAHILDYSIVLFRIISFTTIHIGIVNNSAITDFTVEFCNQSLDLVNQVYAL